MLWFISVAVQGLRFLRDISLSRPEKPVGKSSAIYPGNKLRYKYVIITSKR